MSKDSNRIAIAYIVDSDGDILMGRRKDNDKFTQPGGHIHVGECPYEGLARELKEEAGLDAKSIKLVDCAKKGKLMLYLFEVTVDKSQEIDVSGDPDEEVDDWNYMDPNNVRDELHVPVEDNILLKYWIND